MGLTRHLVTAPEFEANLSLLGAWDRDFQIPDPIRFRDVVHCRAPLAEFLSCSQQAPIWGRALEFPYPNGPKLRRIAVLDAVDLTLLRTSTGRLAWTVESQMSPSSFGSRTERCGLAWRLRHRPWKDFSAASRLLLLSTDSQAMYFTDIANYFGSIDLGRLEARLRALKCEPHAADTVVSGLRKWASVDGLVGLPIGPEACTVLGNAFLIPVDRMLSIHGAHHLRWMDDFRFVGKTVQECESTIALFDDLLSAEGLSRSVPKTLPYLDRLSAIAALRDPSLASLGHAVDVGAPGTMDELRAMFERDWASNLGMPGSRYRFYLKQFTKLGDAAAAELIATDPDLANIDPKASADYLAAVGLNVASVVNPMFEWLCDDPSDRTDAWHLHQLRVLSGRRGGWGSAEGGVFESIADDPTRRPSTRGWAAHAWGCTSSSGQRRIMESTEAEGDPLVRRAKLSALRKFNRSKKRSHFLRHVCEKWPDLKWTALWLDAA